MIALLITIDLRGIFTVGWKGRIMSTPGKSCAPIFIENSRVPVCLSALSPIDIHAINLVFFVFCRTKMSDQTKRHETIHFKQWLELLIVGFAVLYGAFYLWFRLVKRLDGPAAYRAIPFEREAYANQETVSYLFERKMYAWTKYIRSDSPGDTGDAQKT